MLIIFLKLRDRLDKFGFAERLIPGILAFQDAQKMQHFARQCGVYIPLALKKELDKTMLIVILSRPMPFRFCWIYGCASVQKG